MEEQKIMSPAIKGFIISLLLIAFSVASFVFGFFQNKALGMVPLAIMVGGIIWTGVSYSNQMNANVSFGNVFGHSFKAAALIAALCGLWLAASLTFLFPDAFNTMMAAQRSQMEANDMSPEEIDKLLNGGKNGMIAFAVILSVILYLVIGAVASLIAAAVAKKNPNPTPFQQ